MISAPHGEQSRVNGSNLLCKATKSAQHDNSDYRKKDKGKHHHGALKKVGPGNGKKTAHHRIEKNNAGSDNHPPERRNVERHIQHLACGQKLGRHIKCKEKYDDKSRRYT